MTHANKPLKGLCLPLSALLIGSAVADDYEWLEDVLGDASLAWVQEQNDRSLPQIESYPGYHQLYDNALAILNSSARTPEVTRLGEYYYNFWQDAEHLRGIYRRTTLDEYRKEDPQWQTVLDIDALALSENANWVYKGANCLYPEYRHCLVSLSDGGADAVVTREFDMRTLRFVEDGFILPEAKPNTETPFIIWCWTALHSSPTAAGPTATVSCCASISRTIRPLWESSTAISSLS